MSQEDKPPKRKRSFLLHEMITQSQRAWAPEPSPASQKATAELRRVAEEATQLIKKINQPPEQSHSLNHNQNHTQNHSIPVRPTVSPTLSPTLSPSVSQSVPHSVRQSVRHSVRQSKPQSKPRSELQSEKQSPPQSRPPSQSHSKLATDPFWSLTPRQAAILTYLITNKTRITKHALISEATGYPYLSVRDALYSLARDGFLKQKTRYRRGNFQGFKYLLDEEKCALFLQRQESLQAAEASKAAPLPQSAPQSEPQSEPQSASPTLTATVYYSSSSFLNNKTTTTKGEIHKHAKWSTEAINDILATHPELGYWRQKGLTAKQVEQWLELTGASLESLIQSLCHCRYEMVELDKEASKPVDNVFNWFFRVIERAGYYPRPKGYKSYLDRQLELEQQLLAEKQEKLRALEEIRQQAIAVERELAFQEMLNNQESELYQECYRRINNYAKQTKLTSIFTRAMREAFNQVMDEREQQLLAKADKNPDGSTPP